MATVQKNLQSKANVFSPYTRVAFNNYDINNVIQITETALHDSAPTRNLAIYDVAKRDGEKLVSAYFGSKEITITGFIQSTTQGGLEILIDSFKQKLQGKAGNLDIEYTATGVFRRYIATFSELIIHRDPENIDWCPFSVKFVVPSGKGQSVNQSVVSYGTIDTTLLISTFNNVGSAEAFPQAKITLASGSANITTMSLASGGITVTISGTVGFFANSDIFIFDFSKYMVTKNGSPIAYTGYWPVFNPGLTAFTLNTDAPAGYTTANFEIDYYPSYL